MTKQSLVVAAIFLCACGANVEGSGASDASSSSDLTKTSKVFVAAPAPNATLKGDVWLSAGITGLSNVSRVDFLLDGSVTLGPGTRTADGYLELLDTTGLSNATHQIVALATTSSGTQYKSAAVTVTVNNADGNTSHVTVSTSTVARTLTPDLFNYGLMLKDNAAYVPGDDYAPGFTLHSVDAVAYKLEYQAGSSSTSAGFFETTGSLTADAGVNIHTYLDPGVNAAAGTYRGAALVEYKLAGDTTWRTDGPTINYTLTVQANSTNAAMSVSGTDLMLNGNPYNPTGVDLYASVATLTGSCGGIFDPSIAFNFIPDGSLLRIFAFQNFFAQNGKSLDWSSLDTVMALAKAHDDKVVLVLANEYNSNTACQNYYGNTHTNINWFTNDYKNTIMPGDIMTYRNYVAAMVAHEAGNATIAFYQMINEGHAPNPDGSCSESAALAALQAFASDMGGVIGSGNLMSLGVLYYGYPGALWCGAQDNGQPGGDDYKTLMSNGSIDICDYHDYGYPTVPLGEGGAAGGTRSLLHAIADCAAANKPIIVGETGILADSLSADAPRAVEFQNKFHAQMQAGVSAEMVWTWTGYPVQYDTANPNDGVNYAISGTAGNVDPTWAALSNF